MPQPLTKIAGAYLYDEYATDPDINAWWQSRNSLTQGYLNWWNSTPLGLYTSNQVTGALLDWIGQGIYGLPRPIVSTERTGFTAGLNANPLNSLALNGSIYSVSGIAEPASDGIYKQFLTWWLWRGDGMVMNTNWLKRRVMRFVTGVNGSDMAVGAVPPSIVVSGDTITITIQSSSMATIMQDFLNSGLLLMPFIYTPSVVFTQNYEITNEAGTLLTNEAGLTLETDGVYT